MKPIKTTLIIAAAMASLTSTMTTAQANTKNFRTGVYAGAEMGWLHEEHKYREEATVLPPFNSATIVSSTHKGSDSFLPGIFLGYRHSLEGFLDCHFIGFELNAQINSAKTNAKFSHDDIQSDEEELVFLATVNTKHHLRGNNNIKPSLVFGRHFNDKYGIYGKAGYDFGQYKYRLTESTESIDGITVNSKKSHKDFNHWFVGIGGEYAINCLWSARVEYQYTFNTNKKYVKMTANETSSDNYNTRLKISSSALKFGIFAKF